MSKLWKKRSLLTILGIALIATLGTGYFSAESNANSNTGDRVNVWDRETVSDYRGTLDMTVYRSPNCGCCGIWVEHAQKHDFKVKDIKTEDMEAIKQKYGVPPQLASCHTTIIDGYVMEGHIPADDIKRFLAAQPDAVGLAVPGMPLGTPGMEAGDKKQPFQVLSFNERGEVQVFKEYQSY
ncbi:DUF411 domain-containing protein [Myxosarcina sp. GI1]|uniref:DUF411 domain-containing protein n=1 Tax=Myxosarcina sp. GI1 TaxID=1541065 RepID=UPI00056C6A52|nr:DUF411 domain-containing protein [Myxosarcina sp. GI1]